jgi:hypothetical protein
MSHFRDCLRKSGRNGHLTTQYKSYLFTLSCRVAALTDRLGLNSVDNCLNKHDFTNDTFYKLPNPK